MTRWPHRTNLTILYYFAHLVVLFEHRKSQFRSIQYVVTGLVDVIMRKVYSPSVLGVETGIGGFLEFFVSSDFVLDDLALGKGLVQIHECEHVAPSLGGGYCFGLGNREDIPCDAFPFAGSSAAERRYTARLVFCLLMDGEPGLLKVVGGGWLVEGKEVVVGHDATTDMGHGQIAEKAILVVFLVASSLSYNLHRLLLQGLEIRCVHGMLLGVTHVQNDRVPSGVSPGLFPCLKQPLIRFLDPLLLDSHFGSLEGSIKGVNTGSWWWLLLLLVLEPSSLSLYIDFCCYNGNYFVS